MTALMALSSSHFCEVEQPHFETFQLQKMGASTSTLPLVVALACQPLDRLGSTEQFLTPSEKGCSSGVLHAILRSAVVAVASAQLIYHQPTSAADRRHPAQSALLL